MLKVVYINPYGPISGMMTPMFYLFITDISGQKTAPSRNWPRKNARPGALHLPTAASLGRGHRHQDQAGRADRRWTIEAERREGVKRTTLLVNVYIAVENYHFEWVNW